MNKQIKRFISIISILTLLFGLFSLPHFVSADEEKAAEEESIFTEERDWVKIVALSPNHYENYTDEIEFTATVKYSLQTKETGIVYLGFNTDRADYYEVNVQESDHIVVSKGQGTVTLSATVVPVNWNSGLSYAQQFLNGHTDVITTFRVYANISEYPHAETWTPLAIFEEDVVKLPEDPSENLVEIKDDPDNDDLRFSPLADMLPDDSAVYDPHLAHFLIACCNSVHDETSMVRTFHNFGFDRYKTDYVMDDHLLLAYGIGIREYSDGSKIAFVVARGTGSPFSREALSNLITYSLYDNFHAEFDRAAKSLMQSLLDFIGNETLDNYRFVLTGHSRGAAAVNILSARLIDMGVQEKDLYCYSFACPDVAIMEEEAAEQYRSIFNIGNACDFVTWVPYLVHPSFNPLQPVRSSLNSGSDSFHWNKFGQTYWFCYDWDDEDAPMKIFTVDYGTLKYLINTYHLQGKYLDYLRNEYELSKYKNREETSKKAAWAYQKRKEKEKLKQEERNKEAQEKYQKMLEEYRLDRVNVFCPVDVAVYDHTNKCLAYTKDNEVYINDAGEDRVLISTCDDKKVLFIDNTDPYEIIVNGNGTGEMMFEVYNDSDWDSDALCRYEHVKVEEGKAFRWKSIAGNAADAGQLLIIDPADKTTVIGAVNFDGAEEMRAVPTMTVTPIEVPDPAVPVGSQTVTDTPVDEDEEKTSEKSSESTFVNTEDNTDDSSDDITESRSSSGKKLDLKIIAVIVAAVILLIVLIVVILFILRRNLTKNKNGD